MKNTSPKDQSPSFTEIMDKLIAKAPPVEQSTKAMQGKLPSIPYHYRPSKKTFFTEGHNGRGSKD